LFSLKNEQFYPGVKSDNFTNTPRILGNAEMGHIILIGSGIRVFDRYQHWWPWTTQKSSFHVISHNTAAFGANCI